MREDLMKYIDLDKLPNINDEVEKIEEIKAVVEESIVKPEKVNIGVLELKSFSYMKLADLEKRVYLWFLDGWSNKRIKDELLFNWGIMNAKTVEELIKRVNKSMKVKNDVDVDVLRNRYLEQYMDLYRRTLEKKEYLTAQKILDSMTRLQGLSVNRVETKTETVYKIVYE